MEEWIGGWWHRLVTRTACRAHPESAITLARMEKTLGIVFRAFGGDAGLRLRPAAGTRHGARQRLLARIAGSDEKMFLASRDGHSLLLPPLIDLFADPALNRELYLWLAVLAAHDVPTAEGWLLRNQRATAVALARFPALQSRYARLVAACLELRIGPEALPADEAAQERALRAALAEPGSVTALPRLLRRNARSPQPVPLWLAPEADAGPAPRPRRHAEATTAADSRDAAERHAVERVEMPADRHGLLLAFRAESLLSWAEYVKVKRSLDDEPDAEAAQAARNLDRLSIAQDGERVASKIRFDLDLPAAAEDDLPLGPGIALPEWDFRHRVLRQDHCRLQMLTARRATAQPLPPHLRRTARHLRNQFALLAPQRRWRKAQSEGSETDLDAWVRHCSDARAGRVATEGLYLAQTQRERDLACLVLADISLSTDAHATDEQKVIDVIRDSLMLFAEALGAGGDRFALYGFSSLKRGGVRIHELKSFAQRYDAATRGRIAALRPGYYTRLGAAVRRATQLLEARPERQRLLLILSDGKPHDLDVYEGRYGIEDTRAALNEARTRGVRPFCITIDRTAAGYLPHLFGVRGYTLLRRPGDLPQRLPQIYRQMTEA